MPPLVSSRNSTAPGKALSKLGQPRKQGRFFFKITENYIEVMNYFKTLEKYSELYSIADPTPGSGFYIVNDGLGITNLDDAGTQKYQVLNFQIHTLEDADGKKPNRFFCTKILFSQTFHPKGTHPTKITTIKLQLRMEGGMCKDVVAKDLGTETVI